MPAFVVNICVYYATNRVLSTDTLLQIDSVYWNYIICMCSVHYIFAGIKHSRLLEQEMECHADICLEGYSVHAYTVR